MSDIIQQFINLSIFPFLFGCLLFFIFLIPPCTKTLTYIHEIGHCIALFIISKLDKIEIKHICIKILQTIFIISLLFSVYLTSSFIPSFYSLTFAVLHILYALLTFLFTGGSERDRCKIFTLFL